MSEYPISSKNKVKRVPKRGHYDRKTIYSILDASFLCHLGFVVNGQPFVIPTSYGRDGNKIYLHGATTSRMMVNMEKGLPICLTVTHLDGLVLARSAFHHSMNYRSAVCFGTAKKIESKKEKDAALFCFMEHMMKGRWDGIREMTEEEYNRTLTIEMTIETASAKVRDVGVADEPEDYDLDVWAGLMPIKQIAEYPIADEGKPEKMEIPKHILDYYEQNK